MRIYFMTPREHTYRIMIIKDSPYDSVEFQVSSHTYDRINSTIKDPQNIKDEEVPNLAIILKEELTSFGWRYLCKMFPTFPMILRKHKIEALNL